MFTGLPGFLLGIAGHPVLFARHPSPLHLSWEFRTPFPRLKLSLHSTCYYKLSEGEGIRSTVVSSERLAAFLTQPTA